MALVAVLAAVLVLLAVLQYRWSLEISRAEQTRIVASLNNSVNEFRQAFYRELVQVSTAFSGEPEPGDQDFWAGFTDRYHEWARTAARPDLIANVYVLEAERSEKTRLLRLRPGSDSDFEPAAWPPELDRLKQTIAERVDAESHRPPGPPMPELRSFAWTMEQDVPALVRPVFNINRMGWRREGADGPPRQRPAPPQRTLLGFVIVELNRGAMDRLLGDLAQRYFSGPDGFIYNVAVVSGATNAKIIYRSDAQLTATALNPPDARVALLPATGAENRAFEATPPGNPAERAHTPRRNHAGTNRGPFLARVRGAFILPSPGADPWVLLARHKSGSLEAVVAAERMRNLLLSFGVLLLLAVSMALIVLSAQHARRLAHLQMEFVAGVSHELRTPVTVICSAADNLAEGFVGAKDQVKEYGVLIRNQGRRLAGMIEQILQFAAGQSRAASYELAPVSVPEAIGAVLASVSDLPEAAGFTVEREIDPGLPHVEADATALSRCLENLILNAFKYSTESRWVRIRAVRAQGSPHVRISVEDRGVGIEAADLPHIFEPFYRGKAAQAALIHGAGLGLSLARDMAEGMGGRLEAESEPGRGSTFTLELRVAEAAAEPLPRTA